jgi:DamX protein
MSDDRVESHVEIQKFASNADKSNMESVADVFADEIETDFFATSNIQSQLDEVVHLCQFGGNVVSLLGDKGIGKSAFLAEVRRELAETCYCCMIESALMKSAGDVFRLIIAQLEVPVTLASTTGDMLIALRKFMSVSSLHRVVIIIDDADFLNESTLSDLLSLFQGAHEGQFHLLLSGDKNLIERLDASAIVDVLIYDMYLNPFNLDEAKSYIDFKLGLVSKKVEDYFKHGEISSIYKESKGLPLLINKAVKKHFYRLENVDDLGLQDDERRSGLPLLHMGLLVILLAGLIMILIYMGDDEPTDNKRVLTQPLLIEAEPGAEDQLIDTLSAERNMGVTQQAPSKLSSSASIGIYTTSQVEAPVIEKTAVQPPLANASAVDAAKLVSKKSTDVTLEPKPVELTGIDQSLVGDLKKELERETASLTLADFGVPAPIKPSVSDTLSDDRFSVSEQVVMQWPDASYTLQLIGAVQEASLIVYIDAQPNASSLLLVSLTRNNKPWYVVVVGVYKDVQLARQAIQNLPQNQVNAGPWPKKISDLKQDMRLFR